MKAHPSGRQDNLRQSVMLGAVWGLGHTITLFLFDSIALMMDRVIPEQLAAMLEFAVGIMLLLLGFDVLRRLDSGNGAAVLCDRDSAAFFRTPPDSCLQWIAAIGRIVLDRHRHIDYPQ